MYKVEALENSKMECLSCKGACEYSSVAMSEAGSYFTHTCSGPDVPEIHIMNSLVRSRDYQLLLKKFSRDNFIFLDFKQNNKN